MCPYCGDELPDQKHRATCGKPECQKKNVVLLAKEYRLNHLREYKMKQAQHHIKNKLIIKALKRLANRHFEEFKEIFKDIKQKDAESRQQ